MRPIFSPTDFVQIKGRGTRKFNFSKCIVGDKEMKVHYATNEKEHFKLFDFFANCEYFEEKFNYDEVLKLPKPSESISSLIELPQPTLYGYEHTGGDGISLITETKVGAEGMRIDRMFFKKFEENIKMISLLKRLSRQKIGKKLRAMFAKKNSINPMTTSTLIKSNVV